MKTSRQGRHILIEREAARNRAYQDSKGIWTIGVGHTGPEVVPGLVWTNDQIDAAFEKDLKRFEDAVNSLVKVPLKQYEFDALVSFAFNVGEGKAGFGGSTLVRLLNNGTDRSVVAEQFNRWNIPPEVFTRRMGEKHQFLGKRFEARVNDPNERMAA